MKNIEKINELLAILNIDNVEIEKDEIGTWILCDGRRVLIGGETYDKLISASNARGLLEALVAVDHLGIDVRKFRRETFGIKIPTFEEIDSNQGADI
jgi:hypothetical protein